VAASSTVKLAELVAVEETACRTEAATRTMATRICWWWDMTATFFLIFINILNSLVNTVYYSTTLAVKMTGEKPLPLPPIYI